MMRDAVKDRSYRATPLGLEVARYYRWKRNEWGATDTTLRDYEAILARLALYFADLELSDFEPPVGTERLREFWDFHWGEKTPRTRAKVLSVLRDFFAWACRERGLHGNPTTAISRPKQRGVERGTFAVATFEKVISAQPRLRDRVALRLLFQIGLRKGELTKIQFKHFDLARRRLIVFGKGGKIRHVPIVDEQLRLELERHILDRQAAPDEYLLYPERTGPMNQHRGDDGTAPFGVIWEDRTKPMSGTTMHRWWVACLERAGVPHQPMHEARHTAITELLRHPGLISSAAASPARTSASPANAPDSPVTAPASSSSSPASSTLFDPDGFSSRTYPGSSPRTAVGTSESCLERWPTSGTAWDGGFSTAVSSECRSADGVCSSSEPVADGDPRAAADVPARYSLSARAAQGILRRAEKRGRTSAVASLSGLGNGGPDDNDGQASGGGEKGLQPRDNIANPVTGSNGDPGAIAYALRKDPGGTGQGHNTNYVADTGVRRLTPRECERLQGLPDDWTRLDDKTPDSRRYSALGDAVTANVAFWIGTRLMEAQ
jgi:integrase